MNNTLRSESGHAALHQAKLIPLGKKTTEKKAAVSKLMHLIKVMLRENT